jgi:hypothetical protein
MHTIKETDMLAEEIDLLLKKFDEHATEVPQGTVKTMDSQMTCEVCGNVGHLGNDCPEIREEASYINNGYRHQGGMAGEKGTVYFLLVVIINTFIPLT